VGVGGGCFSVEKVETTKVIRRVFGFKKQLCVCCGSPQQGVFVCLVLGFFFGEHKFVVHPPPPRSPTQPNTPPPPPQPLFFCVGVVWAVCLFVLFVFPVPPFPLFFVVSFFFCPPPSPTPVAHPFLLSFPPLHCHPPPPRDFLWVPPFPCPPPVFWCCCLARWLVTKSKHTQMEHGGLGESVIRF